MWVWKSWHAPEEELSKNLMRSSDEVRSAVYAVESGMLVVQLKRVRVSVGSVEERLKFRCIMMEVPWLEIPLEGP